MGGGDRHSDLYRVNYEGSKNLIDTCIESGIRLKRFLFASSIATMGPTGDSRVCDETITPNPITHYGKTKLMAENYLEKVRENIPYTIVRLPLVYGPRSFNGMYSTFKTVNSGFPLLAGNSNTNVGFVKDIVKGIILSSKNPIAVGQIYILGEEKIYNSREIINHIVRVMNKNTLIIRIPYFLLYFMVFIHEKFADITKREPWIWRDSLSSYLNSNWRFSVKKAQKDLAFKAEYPLIKGLKATASWYKKNGFL